MPSTRPPCLAWGVTSSIIHNRREAGYGTSAKIINIVKAARQHDKVTIFQIVVLMPKFYSGQLQYVFEYVEKSSSQFEPEKITTPTFMKTKLK
jgi:hypothetical protein